MIFTLVYGPSTMAVALEDRIARLTILIDLRNGTLFERRRAQERLVAPLGHALEDMRYGRRRVRR